MSKDAPPADEDEPLGSIEIDIDPSLIEEALASVTSSAEDDRSQETEVDLGLAEESAEPAPAPQDEGDERRLLKVRHAELEDVLRRTEDDLARAAEVRDGLDLQLRELRKLHQGLGADFDRFRQRARKDNDEAERRGEERALRAMLEIFDNVERARLYDVSDATQVLSGLQMIVEQFRRQLHRVGFERIPAEKGGAFDPEVHEAVAHVHDFDVPEGAIVEEVAAGFRLRGRLFRPARVTVASAPLSGSK